MKVRVEGLRELDAALGELPKALARGVLRRVALKALQPVADAANALAPDDPATGEPDLKGSVVVGTKLTKRQARLNRKREDKSFVEAFAGTKDAAAVLQEFGTVTNPPQPFMRPAWDQEKAGVLETVKRELGGEIERTAARLAKRRAAGG